MRFEMTPLEIFEYKTHWKSDAFVVTLHSDKRWDAKAWCKKNFDWHRWDHIAFTDVYQDTYLFENLEDANRFKEAWK